MIINKLRAITGLGRSVGQQPKMKEPVVRQYGFHLNGDGYYGTPLINRIKINGRDRVISKTQFVSIPLPDKTVYLAVSHSAAMYFVSLEEKAGNINGRELWIHVDQNLHPDNEILGPKTVISKDTGPDEIGLYLQNRDGKYGKGINIANFMTAVAKKWSSMQFTYLHENYRDNFEAFGGEGMKYQKNSPVLFWADKEYERSKILSLDLDVFNISDRNEMVDLNKVKDKLVKLALKSKVVMLFTSPGYIESSAAEYWMETITAEIIKSY